jgi:hypothetical protein
MTYHYLECEISNWPKSKLQRLHMVDIEAYGQDGEKSKITYEEKHGSEVVIIIYNKPPGIIDELLKIQRSLHPENRVNSYTIKIIMDFLDLNNDTSTPQS